MKLAFCLYKYFPYGGLQRDFLRIALACQQRGYDICVFAMSWEGDVPAGFDVSIVPVRGMTNHGRCLDFVRRVRKCLSSGGFSAVVGFNKMPGLDLYFAADPCYRAKSLERKGRLFRLGGRYRTFCAFEKAVFDPLHEVEILLLAETERSKFIEHYHTDEDHFHLLPPGISRDRKAPANAASIRREMREELGVSDDEFLLLMVGSGFKTKGVDRAIRALAGLPEGQRDKARLFVAGQGKGRVFLKLAARLGVLDSVTLLGPRDDVPRLLVGADVLLQPSYTEAAGMVLIEAMAAGLPVLATDICGYAFHIVRASAGLLIPSPFEQRAFDALLQSMLESGELDRWARNGMAYVENTDVFSLPEKAAEVISDVAMKRRGA